VAEKRGKYAKEVKVVKGDIDEWLGGLNVNLSRKMKSQKTLREELSLHLEQTLFQELRNQKERIENISKWQDQYRGYKSDKSWPWDKCANTAIPITMSNVDAIFVRLWDALWNKRKLILVKPKTPDMVDVAPKIERGLEHFIKHYLKLKEKLLGPVLQALKIGTGMAKVGYATSQREQMRYATSKDKNVKQYKLGGTKEKGVKYVQTLYEGPQVYPIRREDWVSSSDAAEVEDAYMCGFRKYYRKQELLAKKKLKIYDNRALNKVISFKHDVHESSPDDFDQAKKDRATSAGKELTKTDYEKPYEIWELWLRYDVDEDGEEDSIVVTFHKESGAILRCIYNPLFDSYRPFEKFVFYATEYEFDGLGICEIEEKLQVEIDTLHNQRLDRMTQINQPMTIVKTGIGIDNFKLAPGKVWFVDTEVDKAVMELPFHDIYHSTFNEEQMLVQYADRAIGITPAVMGISTAERPVAKETMALQQEANRKFQNGINNIIDRVERLIYKVLDHFIQYQPVYKYRQQEGEKLEKAEMDLSGFAYLRDGIDIELEGAREMNTQEVRREVNLTLYQLVMDYHQRLTGDQPNAEDLVLDVDKIIDMQQQMQPPQQPPGAGFAGPGGQPPGPGGPSGPGGAGGPQGGMPGVTR